MAFKICTEDNRRCSNDSCYPVDTLGHVHPCKRLRKNNGFYKCRVLKSNSSGRRVS